LTRTAFVYSDTFQKYDYGAHHPLKIFRLKLTFELIKSYGLLSLPNTRYVEARYADDRELGMFHEEEYIDVLKSVNKGEEISDALRHGLGPGDNPIFRGLLDWSRLLAGASLQAASLVARGEVNIAFNISGGLHHARASQASGFCYVNDAVLAIMWLLRRGLRVAYIDIDAHHGDGVQDAFYETDQVLTISIHESGRTLFPGTGFESELGRGRGEGYSVNIPMPPYSDDDLFIYAFTEVVPPIIEAFNPDIVVSQLGVDSFVSDPLTHLNYTTNGYGEAVKLIRELAPRQVALGGGGYDIANVSRAWTLAWTIMNEMELPDEIPEDFLKRYSEEEFRRGRIRDVTHCERGSRKEEMRDEVKRVVEYIHQNILKRMQKSTGVDRDGETP
jgi:acetoin utilization protein AcuC